MVSVGILLVDKYSLSNQILQPWQHVALKCSFKADFKLCSRVLRDMFDPWTYSPAQKKYFIVPSMCYLKFKETIGFQNIVQCVFVFFF